MKKLLCLFLVIITLVSVVPTSIFALDTDGETVVTDTTENTVETTEAITVEPSTDETTKATEVTVEPTETTEATDNTVPTEATIPSESTVPTETQPTVTEPTKPVVTTPSKVENFKVDKKTSTTVTLKWSKNADATRYVIYRSVEQADGAFTKYAELKSIYDETKTSYKDKNLKSGRIYKYKIFACRKSGSKILKSKGSTTSTFTPLEATDTLKVKEATTKKIKIAWRKIANATKYEVYRKSENTTTYKKIASVKGASFTDKNITSGKDYIYKVRGLRVANKKLRYSPFASVSASSTVTGVKDVKADTILRRGLFTWKEVSGADGYDVFVKKSNGTFKYEDTVETNAYLTSKKTVGKTYTYQIKPFKKVDGVKKYGKSKKINVNIEDGAYGKTPKGTYIEICTETQTMYMYVKDKFYIKTPVVTGMYNSLDTTHGYHYVLNKKSPARLRGQANGSSWDTNVTYWIAFTYDGQGIHDSTWRYSGYGGNIYKYDGSHGCVNTPYDAVAKIYKKTYTGMPIIVY